MSWAAARSWTVELGHFVRDWLARGAELKRPVAYLISIVVVLLMVGVAFLVHQLLPHANLSLLFLTGVLLVSATTGLGPSLFASLLSFLAFNFFFTTPFYTFAVADEGDVATLAFFLVMAAVTGNLAATMRRESAKRKVSLLRISKLYEFSNRIASLVRSNEILDALALHLSRCLERPVLVLKKGAEHGSERHCVSDDGPAPDTWLLNQAWSQVGDAPVFIETFVFLGLVMNQRPLGLVAFEGHVDPEQMEIARSLCEQAAVALDRTKLAADLKEAQLVSETEQLRSALLSSVSHDLRTPLASIMGSSSSLLEYGESFATEDRKELLSTVYGEAQRLDRYIQNLLDMTRLGQGSLSLRRDWVDLNDLVASAIDRLQVEDEDIRLEVDVEESIPLLWVHGVLIEQALVNLLDNAIRFSPAKGTVSILARTEGNTAIVDVSDQGPGIPEAEREKVFDMFYTVRDGNRETRQGTGLGLAICRGMVGAHGGTVTAHVGAEGKGTRMQIVLPLGDADVDVRK